jgi:hypothetical protein
MTRYYDVACRRCGKTASFHANGLTNETLRKLFIRKKWDIGKTPTQHTCPECGMKHQKPQPQLPTPPLPLPIKEKEEVALVWAEGKFGGLWGDLNELGRRSLLSAVVNALTDDERIYILNLLAPPNEVPHIDSLPVENNTPAPEGTGFGPKLNAMFFHVSPGWACRPRLAVGS